MGGCCLHRTNALGRSLIDGVTSLPSACVSAEEQVFSIEMTFLTEKKKKITKVFAGQMTVRREKKSFSQLINILVC